MGFCNILLSLITVTGSRGQSRTEPDLCTSLQILFLFLSVLPPPTHPSVVEGCKLWRTSVFSACTVISSGFLLLDAPTDCFSGGKKHPKRSSRHPTPLTKCKKKSMPVKNSLMIRKQQNKNAKTSIENKIPLTGLPNLILPCCSCTLVISNDKQRQVAQ